MFSNDKTRLKISVVIPTYKNHELLLRCIHALMKQDFPLTEFEIVVVSDGYDAGSYDAVGRFNPKSLPRIRYHQLKKKSGPAAARNRGWQEALGELIVFTDDDCIPEANWLSEFWQAYETKKNKTAAFRGRIIVPLPAIPTDYERNLAKLEKAEFTTANCACTRKALLSVGGFDERFTVAGREDKDLQFKLIERAIPIFDVDQAMLTRPVKKASWGSSLKEEKKGVFNALLYKKYPQLYKQKLQSSIPFHYYLILLCLLIIVSGIVIHDNRLIWSGVSIWIGISIWTTIRRLRFTSHSIRHIGELFVTSMILPILSLYYRIYGALKFGVLVLR